MPHNARVLCLTTDSEVIDEMRRVEAVDAGIRHMLPKARYYLIKLESVPLPDALTIKESFLSNGGEATLRTDAVQCVGETSDVLISGTRKQYQTVFQTLLEHGRNLPQIASEIEAAMRHFDSTPNVPNNNGTGSPKLASMFQAIGSRTLIMGILNVTPDSFSDGGRFINADAAVMHGMKMLEDGADILDIGGETTRPGSQAVPVDEEIRRVVPVIKELAGRTNIPISIDTNKSAVAEAALDAGALIVNDISSGLFDPNMPQLVARRRCPAILMHIKGTPQDMQVNPTYKDLMGEICAFLRERISVFVAAGADEKMLIVDPGIGFGKRIEHNLEIMRRLRELKSIGRPILVGTSRKSTIGKILGDLPADERVEGTAATVAISIMNGADIVRVHDVKEMARVAMMTDAVVHHEKTQ